MIDQLVKLIINESKWLMMSMAIAVLTSVILLYLHRNSAHPVRRQIMTAMNLFFGVTIGVMALGHLLAVTTKLLLESLQGPIVLFYVIGIVLAVPAWWLFFHTRRLLQSNQDSSRRTVFLNVWLAMTLLALGIHNLPLAIPAIFNIGYHHSGRVMGWIIVSIAVLFNIGLFIGSLIFFASGQSFEQFSGIE